MKVENLFVAMMTIFAVGCSGGGGGSSSAPSGGGSGDGGGGGGPSDTANPAFYGFNTQYGTTVADVTTFQLGELYQIPSHVAFVITDPDNRYMDALIYQPSCIQGLLEYDYNAVLIHGASTAPSRVRIKAKATNPVITTVTELQSGGYVDLSTETLTGTCSEGMFYDTSLDSTLFQNGNTAIYKDLDGNIYFGIRSTVQVVDKTLLYPFQYKRYDHLYNGAITVTNRLATWGSASSSLINLDSAGDSTNSSFGFTNPNTTVKGFADNSRASVYTIQGEYRRIWDGNNAVLPLMGVTGILGGKVISIHNGIHSNAQAGDIYQHNGVDVADMKGTGSLSIYIAQ